MDPKVVSPMVHSTWDEWFVTDELEAVDPTGLSIWYLGCNAFVLRSSTTTVYIDPYFGNGRPPRLLRMDPIPVDPAAVTLCDAVLITHEHLDHMHPPSFRPLVRDVGAKLFAPQAAYEEPDIPVDRSELMGQDTVVTPGDQFEIGDLTVHVRSGNDPDAIGEVTYVIEHDAGTFFHGGDSRVAEAFHDIGDEFDIDVGVLAMGSVAKQYYPDADELTTRKVYMDDDEVVEATNLLELDRLVPSHYRMWKGVGANVSALASHTDSFEYPQVIERVDVGDRLEIDSPGIVPRTVLDR
jgi:L-ascorbate 6-phosphate lactonase